MKKKIQTPFFVVNPKSYLYGESLLNLAKKADELAKKHPLTIFFTAPYAELATISANTEHLIVTAQHMDGIKPGRGMGHVLPEALKNAGAKATFLNHAEHPMTLAELVAAVDRGNALDMISIVCADSIQEARAIAMLDVDIILCEPTELIGTGKTSDEAYIEKTNQAVKEINPNILMMQAAGISTADDVYRTISLGAEGTGCTSGIVCAEDPSETLEEMILAVIKAKGEKE